jgi:transposase
VLPPRRNRKHPGKFSNRRYKSRNLVERFVKRIKQDRRVAARYKKTARNYLAFVHLASFLVTMGVTDYTT